MFDYFYGNEAEQFQYYRIPALLFTDDVFKKLSTDAKVLYGLLLDRAGLSAKNGWKDADGKIYVYYTLEEATEYLNCARDKAIKSFAELDAAKGIGLIERKRQGLGRPTKIYVKSFYRPSSDQKNGDRLQEVDKTDLLKSKKTTLIKLILSILNLVSLNQSIFRRSAGSRRTDGWIFSNSRGEHRGAASAHNRGDGAARAWLHNRHHLAGDSGNRAG